MSFDAFLSNAKTSLSDIFMTSATYSPLVGDDVACYVNIEHDVATQPNDYNATLVELATTIEGLYDVIGEPDIGSTFLVGSTTYTVKRIEYNDKTFVKMVVK